jgi:DUF4097 and DUF4098 domain-containing protein YvlB
MKTICTICVVLAIAALIPAGTAGREISKDYNESFDVSKGAILRLDHGDGDVTITPWDKDVIEVTIRYRADLTSVGIGTDPDFEAEFKQDGNVVHVRGREKSSGIIGYQHYNEYEYTYTINAPSYTELDFRGDDGSVSIEDWNGAIECELDDGDIVLNRIDSPEIRLEFEDGDVEIEDCSGELFARGEDGDIDISNCNTSLCRLELEDGDIKIKRGRGDYEISLEDGDLDMFHVKGRMIDIIVSDGNVDISLLKGEDIEVDINTDDGDVTLALEKGISASYRVDTSDGDIRIDLPSARKEREDDDWASGELGSGKGRITIDTADGRVILKEFKK